MNYAIDNHSVIHLKRNYDTTWCGKTVHGHLTDEELKVRTFTLGAAAKRCASCIRIHERDD